MRFFLVFMDHFPYLPLAMLVEKRFPHGVEKKHVLGPQFFPLLGFLHLLYECTHVLYDLLLTVLSKNCPTLPSKNHVTVRVPGNIEGPENGRPRDACGG